MNLLRVRAMARKEWIHIVRDPRSLGMAIAIPLLLLILFGYALTLDVDNVPLVVWDQSGSEASRDFVSRFTGSRYFSLRAAASNYREVERAIDDRRAVVALVIPPDFAGRVAGGRPAPVQLIVDGSDANTATIAMGYARIVALAYSRDAIVRETQRIHGASISLSTCGHANSVASAFIPDARGPGAIEIRPRVWFNDELESKNYIVPGLIAVIMMVIAALLTSLTVAREWEGGAMEQLISTPVRGSELIAGKLLPYFVIGMLDVLLAILMGEFLFQVPLRGSVALLFGVAAIFLAGTLSLGILISIVTKSQLLASQLAIILTFLPAFLLSGFMYAIGNMPKPIQLITYLIPARYFVAALKGIYLKGIGLEILALEAGLLTLFAVGVIAAAQLKFKKKMTL
ncbi:MAG: ABC transporter permease [Lentisphaerae bacterium]|nr:ABC transporter permease [Lentisphaerota bacterium]